MKAQHATVPKALRPDTVRHRIAVSPPAPSSTPAHIDNERTGPSMRRTDCDPATLQALQARLTPLHLRQRLGIEQDSEARVFGQGHNWFHIENWASAHQIIRLVLRLSFLHARGRRNAMKLRLCEHTLHLPHLPEAFDGYTILQLSDLHLDMNPEFPAVLAGFVRELEYDLCVLTGDFRMLTYGPIDGALRGMDRVRANLGEDVYGVLGNHDSIRMLPPLEEMGIRMLMNESVRIGDPDGGFRLAGVDDPHYFGADNLENAARGMGEHEPSILLAHSPEIYRQAAHAGYDVLLCGHTHGGQIRLPGGIPIFCNADCPRRFCAGPWRYNHMQGYTSLGTGSSVVDVRFNCPPEVTLHRLRAAPADQ